MGDHQQAQVPGWEEAGAVGAHTSALQLAQIRQGLREGGRQGQSRVGGSRTLKGKGGRERWRYAAGFPVVAAAILASRGQRTGYSNTSMRPEPKLLEVPTGCSTPLLPLLPVSSKCTCA